MAGSLPDLGPPPIPILAKRVGQVVDITFDRNLAAAPSLDTGNWTGRWSGTNQNCVAALVVAPDIVRATFVAGTGTLGSEIVNYDPPPFDVMATDLVPAAAFAAFPIT